MTAMLLGLKRKLGPVSRRYFSTTRSQSHFKILFAGADSFSVGTLKAVLAAPDVWKSIHVLTPDVKRIWTKGKRDHECELMTFAKEQNLDFVTVSQVISTSDQFDTSSTRSKSSEIWTPPSPFDVPDPSHLFLTASFGHMIPNAFLNKFDPAHRLNLHPSLLPKYRGAAPLQWTLINGDETMGITVQRLNERKKGVDSGDIVGVRTDVPVPPHATFESLMQYTSEIGGELLVQVLREIIAGTNQPQPQDPSLATRARKLDRQDCVIDWSVHDAKTLEGIHRALSHRSPLRTPKSNRALVDPIYWKEELPPLIKECIQGRLDGKRDPKDRDARIEYGTAFIEKLPKNVAPKSQWRAFIACKPIKEGQDYSWLVVNKVKLDSKEQSNPVYDLYNRDRTVNKDWGFEL